MPRFTPSNVLVNGLLALTTCLAPGAEESHARPPFDPGKVGFTVEIKGHTSPYQVMAVFVLPGEEIAIHARPDSGASRFRITSSAGAELETSGKAKWKAPMGAGLCPARIVEVGSGRAMTLNIFVIVPISKVTTESLNGYSIGKYPAIAFKGLDIYRPPKGLVEVTPANLDTPVSPHFALGQFLCKQEAGWPRYLVLRTRLLLKLELILEKVNQAGLRCDTFTVMSGYRTPSYNHLIGNVRYSRHLWGGAADIFIDEDPADGMMDDLNRDGTIDVRDAHVLYEIIDRLYGRKHYEPYVGGLGAYRKTASHGPFVHVDARGFHARWGE